MSDIFLPATARYVAQVECNAPLSAVNTRAEVVTVTPATPDANTAADILRQKATADQAAKDEKLAKFQRETCERIKRAARARKEDKLRTQAVLEQRVVAAASDELITNRPALGAAPRVSAPAPPAEPPQPPPPSQLDRMRAGLLDQAAAARNLMLSRCVMLNSDASDPAGAAPPMPLPPPPTAEAREVPTLPTSTQCAAATRSTAESRSVLRAVMTSAARADREAARRARKARTSQARRSEQRQQLADAMASEREAAERAEALRREVAALEQQAIAKEAQAQRARQEQVHQRSMQRGVEASRYLEAYRKQLQLEVQTRSRPLPPLCSCGLDPLENHTDNCARNCYFFKDPQAYGRALSALFVRPIVLD